MKINMRLTTTSYCHEALGKSQKISLFPKLAPDEAACCPVSATNRSLAFSMPFNAKKKGLEV